jgi:hypothetical protein
MISSSDKASAWPPPGCWPAAAARQPRARCCWNAWAAEADPEVKAALPRRWTRSSRLLAWGERLGVLFTGISLGSILLLVALGLAITYG